MCASSIRDAASQPGHSSISEMRWNGCGKMTAATGETILYSGKSDEVGHHEQGVGLTFTRRENNNLMEGSPFLCTKKLKRRRDKRRGL